MDDIQAPEYAAEDAGRYLAEMKSDALGKLFPSPEELKARIKLITHLTGKHPNLYKLYLGLVEYTMFLAMREGKPVPSDNLEPSKCIGTSAPPISGERANQAVEIARAAPKEQRKGWFDGWFGG